MSDYRNVWALITAVAFLQIGSGILGVVTPLGLDRLGTGTVVIGLIAALHAVGYMLGATIATSTIRTFGNIRIFSAAASASAVSVLMMGIELQGWAWAAIRLVQGVAFALMFSSAESWLGAAIPAARRGSVNGFYHLVAKAALIIGPFFVAGLAATDSRPFMWCAIFMALSLLPICLTRRGEPPVPDVTPLSIRGLFELAPAAVIAAFMAGIINSGTMSLLPIFAESALAEMHGGATRLAALAAAAAWGGGLISQWPVGRLSDVFDRRMVIAVMAALSSVAALGLGMGALLPAGVNMALLAVWGAGSLSYYAIAVAHAIDRAAERQIAQVMAGLLFVWAVGSVMGPLLSGAAMRTPFGPGGLFIWAGLMGVVLTVAMLWRRLVRAEPSAAEQEPWSSAMPTLVTKGEIDPRIEP